MKSTMIRKQFTGFSRIKLFLALSRVPHLLLDLATPAFAALLWLGHFPSLKIIIVGLITAFAGYTSVYALNDVIGYKSDKKKIKKESYNISDNDLDAVLIRHPIAQDLLSIEEGIFWVVAWAFLALIGAYILNPICALIFIMGSLLEIFYCLLWNVSSLRTIVSGAVKTSGGIAAVFAVDPAPSPFFLVILFLWLFLWEIGGQNIPNDWVDIVEDKSVQTKTMPLLLGSYQTKHFILICLIFTILMNIILLLSTPVGFEFYFIVLCFFIGIYLLLVPVYRLLKSNNRQDAVKLFNKSSYYPLALFIVILISVII